MVACTAFSGCLSPSQNVQSRQITASILVSGGNWTLEYRNITTQNNTAFGFLREMSAKLNFSMGSVYYPALDAQLVTSINGTQNGAGGKYWQYYVNGVYGNLASDKKELKDGDAVEWRFEQSAF